MAPPRELIEDAVAEILLRLPPEEPENLFRASLVCKVWLRVVTDPAFLRRYRAFHRTPPLLGYMQPTPFFKVYHAPRLLTNKYVSLAPYPSHGRMRDCRHGRVLLCVQDNHIGGVHCYFIIWDPVTGDQKIVWETGINCIPSSAVVCCAVSGCDHLNCHGGPFRLIIVGIDGTNAEQLLAYVYSSETSAWSAPVTVGNDCEIYAQLKQDALNSEGYFVPNLLSCRGAVIGDEVYFVLDMGNTIVKYNIHMNSLSMIRPPLEDNSGGIALMEMDDSSLGFVSTQDSSLYLWSKKLNSEGAAEWVQCKVVELGQRIPLANYQCKPYVVGAAEGVGVIFVSTGAGLLMANINSGQVKRIDESLNYRVIYPLMSFYTPECSKILTRKAKDSLVSDVSFN